MTDKQTDTLLKKVRIKRDRQTDIPLKKMRTSRRLDAIRGSYLELHQGKVIIICDRQLIGIIFAVVIINTFILIVISQTISLIVPIHFVEEASNHQQWSLQLAAKRKGRVVGQSLN